jgi:integrase
MSGWWIGSWVDSAGKQHRKRLSQDEAMARETLTALEGEAIRNRLLEIRPLKRIRFDGFCERFMEYCRVQVKAWRRYDTSVRSLKAFFGNRFLTAIEPDLIERYREKRLESVERSTINRDMQVLKRMFNLAIPWGYARENPVRWVKFFRESIGRLRYLTRALFEKLYEVAPEHLKPLLVVAVHTGMRQAEMLTLTWAQVDLENGFVSLVDTKNSTPRKVPLNQTTRKTFLELKLKAQTESVFSDSGGHPLPSRTVQWQFKRVLEKAGIENFRFHDLRHTCASWMAMADVPILTIKEVLGHKDVRMTLRYSHLSPDQKVDAVKRLDRFVQSKELVNQDKPQVPGEAATPY